MNSLGMRERELGEKGTHQVRILVLGDSFTFGTGVEAEDVYPRQIETTLHDARHANVVVINAGVPGYGTLQETLWFERLVDVVKPDPVLLGFFLGNDFLANSHLIEWAVIDGYLVNKTDNGSRLFLTQKLGIPPEIKIALHTRSHLYTALMNAWSTIVVNAGLATKMEEFEIYHSRPSPMAERAIAATKVVLDRLASDCNKRHLPLAIVSIPDRWTEDKLNGESEYDINRAADVLRGLVQEESVLFLDLGQALRGNGEYYYPVDGHLTRVGHQVVGTAIARSLLDGDLQPLLRRDVSQATHQRRH